MIPIEHPFEKTFLPVTSITSGLGKTYAPSLFCLPIQIVNVIFVGNQTNWVLIDAGMPHSADVIIEAASHQFGEDSKPKAIILTHGHFDHVGAIVELMEYWQVPVYAHELELPYLIGQGNYPEGDPTVDSGFVAKLSPLFPNHGIDLGNRVHTLPRNGEVPYLDGWRWIHTPGHTPGHVSFFREEDRALIVGDAFVTVEQESLYKVFTQKQEINGPPKYFTTDWNSAFQSVKSLAELKPSLAITGHGIPMQGEELEKALTFLVEHFQEFAVPEHGRFVH